MSIIPENYLDLLQSTTPAHIATIGPKGEPQVSPVWFGWDGTHILFIMKKARQKYHNLLREPRVALSIVVPANPSYRSLEIRGKVAHIDTDLSGHFLNLLSQKYLKRDTPPEEAGPAEERIVIFVEPERVIPFPPQANKKES